MSIAFAERLEDHLTIGHGLDTNVDTVTRVEIADHVEAAFAAGAANRPSLLAAARETGARGALLSVLESLPERQYGELRQLWTELPEVPIGL